MIVLLSRSEFELLDSFAESGSIVGRATVLSGGSDGTVKLDMTENDVDELRDVCGELLLRVGFDESYAANEKGRTLENLIDKLFLG